MRAVLALSIVSVLGGCAVGGGDLKGSAASQLEEGAAAPDAYEAGALDVREAIEIAASGHVPSYRVESFGGTTLHLRLTGTNADPYLVVEGPLAGNGDGVPVGTAIVVDENDDAHGLDSELTVTLTEPGAYRVIASTYQAHEQGAAPPAGGTLRLAAECTAHCARAAITNKQLLAGLRASGQLDALVTQAKASLATLVPDDLTRVALTLQLDNIVASPDFAGLERFPTLPLRQVGAFRTALGGATQPRTPSSDAVVRGAFVDLLGDCTADRAVPPPAHASLPGVGNGHFADLSIPACEVARSDRLAAMLTSMSAQNGSSVSYRGHEYTRPEALVYALLESGHRVEVRNERTYANFISLTTGGRDVIWPVWLDTGIEVAGGEHLTIPVGHSQITFRISGPDVTARVMFYLGTTGAAFFGQSRVRPEWTGMVTSYASTDFSVVIGSMQAAAGYLQRIRTERSTVAAGMPADGYGFVGVCNDSVAVVEYLTRETITTFPLARAASLDAGPSGGDPLDPVFRALPHDVDGAPTTRADSMRRILAMTPHALDSALILDETLRTQLRAARTEVDGAVAR